MAINKKYISDNNTYKNQNNPKYIVIHETDNYNVGAGAERHADAQFNGHLITSVQFYCGSDGIYQAAEIKDGTWSIGKEYGGTHKITDANNRNTINIEICVNPDGDYDLARKNAIELTKYLMKEYNIPYQNVIRHFDAKGKYCPRKMLEKPDLWNDFIERIQSSHDITDIENIEQTNNEKEPSFTGINPYTHKEFIMEVQEALKAKVDGIAGKETLSKTITISRYKNKHHKVVTPLERYFKQIGYYMGEIEEDTGNTPIFGLGMEKAVNQYQKNILKYKHPDGEITANNKTWKSILNNENALLK